MRRLQVWNPWGVMPRDFFDMDSDKFLSDDIQMNVYEKDDLVTVVLKAAGFGKDDLDVKIEANMITVSGTVKKESEEEEKAKKYYRKEISSMSFTRTTELPSLVDTTKTKAVYKDGILTITMPKKEEAMPKKIDVQVE